MTVMMKVDDATQMEPVIGCCCRCWRTAPRESVGRCCHSVNVCGVLTLASQTNDASTTSTSLASRAVTVAWTGL